MSENVRIAVDVGGTFTDVVKLVPGTGGIAAIIINHYNGKVHLESDEGLGTKAYIKIPLYNEI